MKILNRSKIKPIQLCPGDSIRMIWKQETKSGWFSKKKTEEKILLEHIFTPEQGGIFDEAVLFETEFEGRKAYGGMILEKQ